jgi:O-antigen/teichoic acid export membrane protein
MSENKKIAKNSIILYVKLAFSTIIGLYTTRIVLIELGADNFGLYNVVGGIVAMMGFINSAMLTTTYRYIAIEIGKGSVGNPNKVFNISLIIHLILALIFFLVGETVGIWYIKNYLNVINSKIDTAIFILHFTIITTVISIITVPFEGVVTAKENFLIRTIVELFRSVLRLVFVIYLTFYLGDKLKLYTVFMVIVTILPSTIFYLYCTNKEKEIIKWKIDWDKNIFKEMFKFMGWIIIGAIAFISARQGSVLIINIFFGTIVNAAYGIATQIFLYTMTFVDNISQAAVPQIMKNHSSGNHERSLNLVYSISKYSFFVMLIPSIPIMLSLNEILVIWLKEVPSYTTQFTNLMIINGLISVIGVSFNAAVQATGKIKKTQIWYSLITLLIIPVTYILFKYNFPPFFIVIINIITTIIGLLIQIQILTKITMFTLKDFINKTVFPAFSVVSVSCFQYLLRKYFGYSLLDVLYFSVFSVILTCCIIYFLGLNSIEKSLIKSLVKKNIQKK